MRAYRFLYWVVMCCALLYGLYSGNQFSWMLFLVLALVLAAALGINLWTVWSFSYIQELSANQGEKGQSVRLRIGVYNDKPFPFTHMRIHVETPDPEENRVLEINLAPKADCSFDLNLGLPLRGEFLVGMTRLELQDVFGLLPMGFDLRRLPYYRQKTLLVLPRVREISLPGGHPAGRLNSGRAAAGAGDNELAYLRGWQAGDPLSRIHWAASAKTRTLFVRQYEALAGGSCLIFLDCRALSGALADRLTECAATLLHAHLSRGDSVRVLGSQMRPPERACSLGELTPLRQWLALLRFDQTDWDGEQLREALAADHYSGIYVLGGAYDPAIARTLAELDMPCFYWLAGPVEAGTAGRHVNAASLEDCDLPEFLYRNLVEAP